MVFLLIPSEISVACLARFEYIVEYTLGWGGYWIQGSQIALTIYFWGLH